MANNGNFDVQIEAMLPGLKNAAGAINSQLPINFTGTETHTGSVVFSGTVTNTGATINNRGSAAITTYTAPVAVNISATLTPAQVLSGYITSTSAAGVTMTMPTGTLLGGAITGCTQGTTLEFYVDNTAGANTVTMAVGTNAVQSDWDLQVTAATASVTPAAITPLTVRSGVAGTAVYRIVFSSATAYTFSRVA